MLDAKKKKKKKKKTSKSQWRSPESKQQKRTYSSFSSLLFSQLSNKKRKEKKKKRKKKTNAGKSQLVRAAGDAHLSTLIKKENRAGGEKELIIISLSMLSLLRSARSVTPLSSVRDRGVPDLFPHCQIAKRSPYTLPGCQVRSSSSRLDPAAIQATGARGEGGGGEEPPVTQ